MVINKNYECRFVDTGLSFASGLHNLSFAPENSSLSGKLKEKTDYNRVVLADDDEDDRMFFADAIGSVAPRANLITMSNGEDLISYLKKETLLPDLIFMDINMPYKNGLECLREIKSNKLLRHLPILIYSTSTNRDHVDVTYRNGASLYIQKPASYTDIKRILKNIFAIAPSEWSEQPVKENFVIR